MENESRRFITFLALCVARHMRVFAIEKKLPVEIEETGEIYWEAGVKPVDMREFWREYDRALLQKTQYPIAPPENITLDSLFRINENSLEGAL